MKLAIIGDFDPSFRPHVATNEALQHSLALLGCRLHSEWIGTEHISADFAAISSGYQGFWIAPGSPYKCMSAALEIIKYARQKKIPTLGTCGGFQHMVIEFARNVLAINDAEHAEYDPYASKLVVNPLSCALAGQTLEIELASQNSKVRRIFDSSKIYEKYYCNFGLNPEYQQQLDAQGFKVVGSDSSKEARILELDEHPFFIATLFVPQDNSSPQHPHKLVSAFIRAIQQAASRA